LSIGSPTRFWIMRTRREARVRALFEMGRSSRRCYCEGRCEYFYKISTKIFSQGLCRMCSRLVCMERRELCKAFPHLKKWCKYWSLGTTLFSWPGWLWRDTYRIGRIQMRNRYVQTPYLSPGFSDCGIERICSGLMVEINNL